MLDGYIASFPTTYVRKVGRTSDEMYKACFSAYMSMKCSSLFPRCSVAQAREEPSLIGGRVPMCLHLCIVQWLRCLQFAHRHTSRLHGDCHHSSAISTRPILSQKFARKSISTQQSMTCLCQQEIHDRLLFPMQHVRKTSPHAGQRPSDR